MTNSKHSIASNYLSNGSSLRLGLWCLIAGFGAYFSMYAFRKPFNAATYDDYTFLGASLKPLLIVSQIIGYMLSKFIGVKVISELQNSQRTRYMTGFILFSLLMLTGFAFSPVYLKPLFILCSALPLGMFWGIVFSYFEGRRFTEFFAIGLSISAIVSSGVLKSFARLLINRWGISDFNIPLVTGLLFLPVIIFFIWMLSQIPPPQQADLEERNARKPLNSAERKALFMKYAVGISLLVAVYVVLTVIRDFRDNYAVELMLENGYSGSPEIFAKSEIIIGIIVLIGIGALVKIKSHIVGFKMVFLLCGAGLLLVGLSTLLMEEKVISPFIWMIMQGVGIYLGYVPFQIVLFERFLAAFKEPGNVGFLMYISDSSGYLGSAILSLFIQSSNVKINWMNSFINVAYMGGIIGLFMIILAYNYFHRKWRAHYSLNLKFLFAIGLFVFLTVEPANSNEISQSNLHYSSKITEQELLEKFKSAGNLFRTNSEEAKRAFNNAFVEYNELLKSGEKFSEAFYQEALIISRQVRLISISKQLIDDMNTFFPKESEHCDCGKCHK